MVNCRRGVIFQVGQKFLFVVYDGHGLPAQNITRPHQNRVTDFPGTLENGLLGRRRLPNRLLQTKIVNHFIKQLTVFRPVEVLHRSPKNLNPVGLQPSRKVNGGLAPELNNHALWLFEVNDIENVF